jgi:NAD(P)-dependent dehydrogenase (short-subunit alcohol dehydrogenase family)
LKGREIEKQFESQVALVTGGGSGIGKAVAFALALDGASVAVNDLNIEVARRVVDEIRAAGGNSIAVAGDVSISEDVKAAVDITVAHYGALNLAVNNAGIEGPYGLLAEVDIDDYKRVMAVNLDSVFYGMRYEIPEMLKIGGGAIVNMSSILGLVGDANAVPYAAAKHGVAGMTKAAALGYADQGVRINSVHPGYIETPMLESLPRSDYDGLVGLHPTGRIGTVTEVANVVLFLLSRNASFVTGSQYVVDGGYTTR